MIDTPRRQPRTPVLIVCHEDGYLEAFADKTRADIHFAMMPTAPLQAEILAEEYLELSLPYRYRRLYFPGRIIGTGQITQSRPRDIAHRRVMLDLLHGLDALNTKGSR